MNYANRQHAGQIMADLMSQYTKQPDTIILALPRGGVPVAYEIAKKLALPMDIFIVRKLGIPEHAELAMGAIASGGAIVLNEELINSLHINTATINKVLQAEEQELARREMVYRGNKPYPELTGKTVILVDDGIATGYTMRAAVASLQQKKPATIIVAVPVAARETCHGMACLVNELICPLQPANFYAVGLWYDDFSQTSDEEVIQLLHRLHADEK